MNWFCEHLSGRHSAMAQKCRYLDSETADGAVLTSNAGAAGAWYIDDELDTRPSTICSWKTIEAHPCNCKCENECPVAREREREIDALVEDILAKGARYAHDCRHSLYSYHMTQFNPMGAIYPKEYGVPKDCYYEVEEKLYDRLKGVDWWKN